MKRKQESVRPNMKHLDYCKTEKMVPEVIELMKQCWDGNPDSRPCFTGKNYKFMCPLPILTAPLKFIP